MRFELTQEQHEQLEKWKGKKVTAKGQIAYKFIPSKLGMLVIVEDLATQEKLDITDYATFK